MDSQSLNMKQSRIKRVVTTLSMVVANKDQDPLARQKYDKVKRILGIDDKQLGEFANFQKNEKKLLKVFGTFMDHEIQTGEPIDLLSALQVVRVDLFFAFYWSFSV